MYDLSRPLQILFDKRGGRVGKVNAMLETVTRDFMSSSSE
jgi:hypothetical protein